MRQENCHGAKIILCGTLFVVGMSGATEESKKITSRNNMKPENKSCHLFNCDVALWAEERGSHKRREERLIVFGGDIYCQLGSRNEIVARCADDRHACTILAMAGYTVDPISTGDTLVVFNDL